MWARIALPRAPAPLTGRDPAEFALRGNAGRRREVALPAEAFKEFFRVAYQPVLRDVIFAGDVWSSMTWIPACQSGNSGSVMLFLKSRRDWRHRGRRHDTREEAR